MSGNNYIRDVQNISGYENGSLIGKNTYVDYENEDKIQEFYRIRCFEMEVFFGSFSTAFIFLSGFALSVIIAMQMCDCKKPKEALFLTCVLPFLIPTFPILLVLVKLISLFHHQKEWKKLDDLLTFCQVHFGSFRQCGLQIFVILLTKNANR